MAVHNEMWLYEKKHGYTKWHINHRRAVSPTWLRLCDKRDDLDIAYKNLSVKFGNIIKEYPNEFQSLFNLNPKLFGIYLLYVKILLLQV